MIDTERRHADCQEECQTAAARGPVYRCDGRRCDMLADDYPQERVDAVLQAGMDALRKNGLALSAGGVCGNCGFTYWEYKGHIIPCPVCECARLRDKNDRLEAAYGCLEQQYNELRNTVKGKP